MWPCIIKTKPGFIGLLFAFLIPIAAQAQVIGNIPTTDQPIRIDGELVEPAWQDALRVTLDIETRPGENIAAPVETEALLIEDGKRLLVAFRAYDPDPTKIRAFLRDRDASFADDFVGVVLDTFNDERRAFEFFVNPLGAQMDLIQDDVNDNEDDSWDAIWSSAGNITDFGYVVEIAIPFTQLRFTKSTSLQTWGIDLLRFYPRADRHRISINRLDRGINCYLCQLAKVQGMENAKPGRDLEIVPTFVASQAETREDVVLDPLERGSVDTDVGVSARWGITPDVTLNVAVNPDFSQVEADVAQLDVNRQFAIFFPETRPFFLEGADYYSSPIDAVFTRNIADPNLGLKLTGKLGSSTYGLIAADDAVTNLLFPGTFGSDSDSLDNGSQAFVGRYRRDLGRNSTLGALVTARSGDDYHNYVAGVDGRLRFKETESVRFQYLVSDTGYPGETALEFEQPIGDFSGSATLLEYAHNARNWFWFLEHQDYDQDFRADLGFITQVGFDKQIAGLGYVWHGDEDNWWNRFQLSGDWDITHDENGRLLERELEARVQFNGPLQSFVRFGGFRRARFFDEVLFDESRLDFYGEFRPFGGLFVGLFAAYGDNIDFSNTRLGKQLNFNPRVNWNINKHLLLRWRHRFVDLDTPEGEDIFQARLNDVRLTWQFNVLSFIRFTMQHQDIQRNQDVYIDDVDSRSRSLGTQLLYSYKINPQTVFFLGYSDNHIDDDETPGFAVSDRVLFMKLGYAWIPN